MAAAPTETHTITKVWKLVVGGSTKQITVMVKTTRGGLERESGQCITDAATIASIESSTTNLESVVQGIAAQNSQVLDSNAHSIVDLTADAQTNVTIDPAKVQAAKAKLPPQNPKNQVNP